MTPQIQSTLRLVARHYKIPVSRLRRMTLANPIAQMAAALIWRGSGRGVEEAEVQGLFRGPVSLGRALYLHSRRCAMEHPYWKAYDAMFDEARGIFREGAAS